MNKLVPMMDHSLGNYVILNFKSSFSYNFALSSSSLTKINCDTVTGGRVLASGAQAPASVTNVSSHLRFFPSQTPNSCRSRLLEERSRTVAISGATVRLDCRQQGASVAMAFVKTT